MTSFINCLSWASILSTFVSAQDANITLIPAAVGFEADNTAFVYAKSPILVVNDGSTDDGGFRTFAVSDSGPFTNKTHQRTGRSKIAVTVHNTIDARDVIVNIPAPDSLIRIFDAETGKSIDSNNKKQLSDWSSACVWRSQKSAESYLFLFGKKMVVQFLVRDRKKTVEVLEVRRSRTPIMTTY
jgi:3-phytase